MALSNKKKSKYRGYKAWVIGRPLLITWLFNLVLSQYLSLFFLCSKISQTSVSTSSISFLFFSLFSKKRENKLSQL